MLKTDEYEIFLSYAREDKIRARKLAENLVRSGKKVWWDWKIVGGQNFRSEIRAMIVQSKTVIVLWSKFSVTSDFVIDEAALAKKKGKLLPVFIDDVDPPMGFGSIHGIRYVDEERDFAILLAAINNESFEAEAGINFSRRNLLQTAGAGGVAILGLASWKYRENISRILFPIKTTTPRIALVIGNQRYDHLPNVEHAENDAFEISALFKRLGFQVATEYDTTARKTHILIEKFRTLLSFGGVGVFYYVGHGMSFNGRDLIIPKDSNFKSKQDIFEYGIDISILNSPIEMFFSSIVDQVKRAGLVLDGLPYKQKKPSEDHLEDETKLESETSLTEETNSKKKIDDNKLSRKTLFDFGIIQIYSTDIGGHTFGGNEANSPFADAVLREIEATDSTAASTAKRIRRTVQTATKSMQTPILVDSSSVDFYFKRPGVDPRNGILRLIFLDASRSNPFESLETPSDL